MNNAMINKILSKMISDTKLANTRLKVSIINNGIIIDKNSKK